MRIKLLFVFAFVLSATFTSNSKAQKGPDLVAGIPVNYDEEKVGTYTLPDPLTKSNGEKVSNSEDWTKNRRPEIVRIFEQEQFGSVPGKPSEMRFDVFDKGTPAFSGKAIRKQVRIYFTKDTVSDHNMDMVIYLPAKATAPSPLLLALSFSPNSLVIDDPGIRPGTVWKDGEKVPATRTAFGKVDVERYIANGIGYASIYYGDIEPDAKDGIRYGIRSVYLKPGNTQVDLHEWGAVSAWSWGLSRAMDYLETDPSINAGKVAIQGASRLGKTVLWTGARDPRFAMVIASISGESGAALSRRNFGETVGHMTDTSRYFYQFAPRYHQYSDKVNQMPMDSHMLIALLAPRPLLLQTGSTDYWSDPKGEYLAAQAAQPVYELFGLKGVGTGPFPDPGDDSMLNTLGYYMHEGGHRVLPEDHEVFIRYIKKHFDLDTK
ncbi:glucuronyl esterase domain-containing protein [Cyclobacterium jeungdonense]|uniref:Acetylxylan esterase n=1 Tax=Cyclobacterium jeungdonense TaxID=708087 RepID=A0ABT8C9W6_9BACT|nr:acetylxylan esterase [Cyclobacterium jeungdonense]MDN3689151.1 acetylxylan esterase [Cyclobacterium jeungdonense]